MAGGSTIQVNGAGLTGATQVNFGTVSATNFMFIDDHQITATVASGSASTVNITVTTPGGTSATCAANQYTYLAVPNVTGINPSSGLLAGGTSVVITGTEFVGNPSVLVAIPLVPTPVPTLGEWRYSLMALLTATLGLGWLRRRRQERQ